MTKEQMPELKPCPFCGGEAKTNDDLQHWGNVFCSCGCNMLTGADKSKSIEAWNKRDESHVQELIEQAFMMGQADCGIDPSYSSAQAYARNARINTDKE